jgi:glyoxylase-like metal-dependent hydrolase (beta-lactamase superfamily II)
VRSPNITFSERISFQGIKRTAEVIDFAGCRSKSDAVMYLPQDGIVFMSDLLFIEHQPFIGDGDPDKLLEILKAVSDLSSELLITGHGPVGNADSLDTMAQYIRTLDALARNMVEDGIAEEAIDQIASPVPYDSWLCSAFFPVNMHFLYQCYVLEQKAAES